MTLRSAARLWFTIALGAYLALSCAPRRSAGDIGAANALLVSGQPEAAAAELARAVPVGAEQCRAASALWSRLPGFESEAAAALAPVAKSGDPECVLAAVRAAVAADRLGQAESWLKGELARNPGDTEAVIEHAKLLGRLGRDAEAVTLLTPRAGDDPRVLNLLGFAELVAGQPDAARGHLERSVAEALRRGRDYAPPHYHLGLYHQARGEFEAALAEFKQAAQVNPQHLEAHYQWMVAAERLGRSPEAAAARAAFEKLDRSRLEPMRAFDDPATPNPYPVDRGENYEFRPAVAGSSFTRTFPAGATVEFGCRAPASAKALFRVTVADGPGAGARLVDVVHEGEPGRAVWVPHRVELPAGTGPAVLRFEVASASRWPLFGGKTPRDAAFSDPALLGPAAARSKDTRPNVLLISLDTLRADRVGAYGCARTTTPNIDRLAARGVRFARMEAASSWTLPSHYSMLSGLSPAAHGVMPDLGIVQGYFYPDRRIAIRGSGREVMLAEALAQSGYRTAAVTEDGWVSPKFGFDQGFRVFRAALEGSLPGTLAGTMAELEATGTRGPWFLFVHTYAVHQPYHAPHALRTRWADARQGGFALPAARVPIEDYYRFRSVLFPPAPSDIRAFRDLYDGQTLWADSLVGELVAWLDQKGLMEQTVVAVTSDHGEELFERGQFDHGDTLYEEVTHVPFVIAAPGRIPAGRVVAGTVSQVDLPATLMDLAGVGARLGDGTSLRPTWSASAAGGGRTAFAEAIGRHAEPLAAVWDGNLKLIRRETAAGANEALFDLAGDPGEGHDLSRARPADYARLKAEYDAHRRHADQVRTTLGAREETLDQESIDRLRSLGYVK